MKMTRAYENDFNSIDSHCYNDYMPTNMITCKGTHKSKGFSGMLIDDNYDMRIFSNGMLVEVINSSKTLARDDFIKKLKSMDMTYLKNTINWYSKRNESGRYDDIISIYQNEFDLRKRNGEQELAVEVTSKSRPWLNERFSKFDIKKEV